MIKLIKSAKIYSPKFLGIKDILIVNDKIAAIDDNIEINFKGNVDFEVIDGVGMILTPGFIDSHVHILGGGGEGGFSTRTPEISLTDITTAGVTTIVGCLGTDGVGRSMEALYAKAKALEEEGISTYIYTGNYRVPVTTITGSIMKDIMMIDKVIGVGEIALSDHRSSQPTVEEIKKIAADARVAGILSGKAGVVNIHLGDGRRMLNHLFDITENTELPITQFIPTHMSRNPYLFEEAIRYAKNGGYIDFTTSSDPSFWEEGEIKASKALKMCLDKGVPEERITFSSDGQGSLPMFNDKKEFIGLRMGSCSTLLEELQAAVFENGIGIEQVLMVLTENPARALKLREKGRIEKGFDADLILLEEEKLEINTVIAKGKMMVKDKKIKVFGTFQK
ncbi:beta-aspartyl-peptidase [Clostridium swellfunianum]|uniref:beta-aspartyl-peptidase n=1 Tax=Clostridium swellfunianum TaxID=1367462 RepID=UPI00202ED4A9|nr:beta-aspartyl-peptidase [Clostridium swellfunianum]MCM0650782.1 beta-aspartyl-peptidase [Clostridium swellfunianum]